MDELCGPEHRTDAVQNLRLTPGFTSGPAGCSGACDCRHYCLRLWDCPGACWWKMHQHCRERRIQGKGGHRQWCDLHRRWSAGPGPRLLVSKHHHQGFLQSPSHGCSNEGVWAFSLHRMGCCCAAASGRRYFVQLLLTRENRLNML